MKLFKNCWHGNLHVRLFTCLRWQVLMHKNHRRKVFVFWISEKSKRGTEKSPFKMWVGSGKETSFLETPFHDPRFVGVANDPFFSLTLPPPSPPPPPHLELSVFSVVLRALFHISASWIFSRWEIFKKLSKILSTFFSWLNWFSKLSHSTKRTFFDHSKNLSISAFLKIRKNWRQKRL